MVSNEVVNNLTAAILRLCEALEAQNENVERLMPTPEPDLHVVSSGEEKNHE